MAATGAEIERPLLAQADVSEAGAKLSQSILEVQRDLHVDGPAPLRRLHGIWSRERLLSMLTVFLGAPSMRDLGLPLRPPWAPAYVIVLNTLLAMPVYLVCRRVLAPYLPDDPRRRRRRAYTTGGLSPLSRA